VTDLLARPGPGKIGLTWTGPDDEDLDAVAIRVSVSAMPDSPDDGVAVPVGPGEEQVVFGAYNGLTHHVAVFAIDRAGNASERSEAVAVPQDPWRSGPDLPQFRPDQTATAFTDTIVLAGRPFGQDEPFLIEYDPSTDRWSNCGPSGCAQPAASSLRRRHAAVKVAERLLLFGGCIGSGGACTYGLTGYAPIEYDRLENRWTNCGDQGCADSVLTERDVHHLAQTIGGKVYVTGGTRDEARILVEEFDPLTNAWTNCGGGPTRNACADAPPALRGRVTSSLVIAGELHVLAGDAWDVQADPDDRADHFVYLPAINEWRSRPDFPGAHAYLVGTIDGVPYAIGGTTPTGLRDPTMYRWDGSTWVKGAVPLPFGPRIDGVPDTGRAVWNGEAYLFGGIHSIEVVIYNPRYDW
jgi:hypothetical protein